MADERPFPKIPPGLGVGFLLLWVLLVVTSVPGVFTGDEANYTMSVLGLRNGSFMAPGTDGLPPDAELLFFDPTARVRTGRYTRAVSTAPPLYAVFALPFSYLGFRGLMALNSLAFVATGLCVYLLAAWRARKPSTPWIALAAFLLGGYSVEYAQGMWPHSLSVALATGGFCLAARAREGDEKRSASLAGLLLGLAVGVRYQNVLFALLVGAGLLFWARRKSVATVAFAAGFAVPIMACSFMNHARLGSWNPVSKGPTYLAPAGGGARSVLTVAREASQVLVAKVADYSFHPVPDDPAVEIETWWKRSPETGAVVFMGALKKAWLQSSPWLALAMLVLASSWFRAKPEGRDVDLRAVSIVVFAILLGFAYAGFGRHDGICFNQRYFLELVPICAVALAWSVEDRNLSWRAALPGATLGALVAGATLALNVESVERQLLGLKIPLLIACLLLLSFQPLVARRAPGLLAALLGASLAWAAVIHLGEDVVAARSRRAWNQTFLQHVAAFLPPGPLVAVVHKGLSEVLAPLLLERDLVVVDPWVDGGRSTEGLVRQLQERRRRVVLVPVFMTKDLVARLTRDLGFRLLTDPRSFPVFELDPPKGGPAQSPPAPRQP